ncbi:MAG TPA: hypothetical protein VII31_11960, partial [Caldimonas sp.]
MLQQVAQACLHGTLVPRVDVEIVGDRAHLADLAVGLRENGSRRVAEAGARRLELLKRLQARLEAGEVVLARAHRPRAPLVLDAGASELGLPGRARHARRLDRRLRGCQRLGGGRPIQRDALGLDAHVVHLDVQLRQRLADAVARRGGVLHGMTQRRRRIDRGKDLAARGLDVGLEPFDLAVGRLVRIRLGLQRRCRALALRVGRGGRVAPRRQDLTRRLAPRVERLELGGDARRALVERLHLLAVELHLLLLPVDGELARMRRFARPGGARLGLDQLNSQPCKIGLDLGHAACRDRLALPRVGQTRARRLDGFGQLPILPGEEDFFPAPQLVAQLLVAPRLAGLPLQRPALLLDLEDDVVDAREVEPRRLQLQLRRAPARLVLRHARRFFDQLPAIGRPRAEDHPDLALLDDRVGLRAQARVHQQLVHVAQAAHLPVDQIFALARAVQPPRDFHFAGDRLDQLFGFFAAEGTVLGRPRHDGDLVTLATLVSPLSNDVTVAIAVAMAVPVGVTVAVAVRVAVPVAA